MLSLQSHSRRADSQRDAIVPEIPAATASKIAAPRDGLAAMVTPLEPLTGDVPARHAYDAFTRSAYLYALPVVDGDGRPIGLINRFRFFEALSHRLGRNFLLSRAVKRVMDPKPLIVDWQMPIDQLSEILVDDESKYIFDGFIVTREGRYVGVGTGYSLVRQLTERKQAELFHLAHHDPLTALPNRQLFADRLQQALVRAERHGDLVSVLYLDVDRFKSVNDSLGHVIGDLLLQRIAARLRGVVRPEDTVSRLSGDEFAIVLSDLRTPAEAELVAGKLIQTLREPHALEEHEVTVSCSIGLSVYPDDAKRRDELLRAADDAVYHAKQLRNTWRRYAPDLRRAGADARLAFSSRGQTG
jgi:diguanylate cyclase (GGDEF)-like protein